MGELLWEPGADRISRARLTDFARFVEQRHGSSFDGYGALWQWSTSNLGGFWEALWDYFEIEAAEPPRSTLSGGDMPGAVWFDGARLSYARHIFRNATADRPCNPVFLRGVRHRRR